MCKVAQGQVVQEEAEAECSLRNADVVGDTMSMTVRVSPPHLDLLLTAWS